MMGFCCKISINDELEFIQQTALKFRLKKSPLHKDKEIKKLISLNGYQYMEDFMYDEIYDCLCYSNFFDDYEEYDDYDEFEIDDINNLHLTGYSKTPYKCKVQNYVTESLLDYQYIYKIPAINIGEKEWDLLFDIMHDFYKSNNIENLFLEDMTCLNRFAISLSLLKSSDVDINCYIEGLGYLQADYMKKNDILELQNKLTYEINFNNRICSNYDIKTKRKTKIQNNKIVNFSDWKNQRH